MTSEAVEISSAWTAFAAGKHLATGNPAQVTAACRRWHAAHPTAGTTAIAAFDDGTGRVVDIDFAAADDSAAPPAEPKATAGRGRPALGVVPREVTLLPRHWAWLGQQRGGASASLRRLVDAARVADAGSGQIRAAQDAAHAFMTAALGDAVGYEEATRALYARNGELFTALVAAWPRDLGAFAARLAAPAFVAIELPIEASA